MPRKPLAGKLGGGLNLQGFAPRGDTVDASTDAGDTGFGVGFGVAIRRSRFAYGVGDAKQSAGGACVAGPKRANGVRKEKDRYPKGQDTRGLWLGFVEIEPVPAPGWATNGG